MWLGGIISIHIMLDVSYANTDDDGDDKGDYFLPMIIPNPLNKVINSICYIY